MDMTAPTPVRVVSPGIRRLTLFISGLALIVGPLLFLLPDSTATLFAWTIKPALMAAFLGGTYCTALTLEVLASREHIWSQARVFFPGMLTFTGAMLLGTLLHLDKFHFADPGLMARATAWAWLIIYILAPPAMAVLLYRQVRRPGGDLPRRRPVPAWFRGLLAGQAAILGGLGLLLFCVPFFLGPRDPMPLWPWALTPLTAQAVGSWLLGFGVATAQAYREGAWERIRLALIGDIVVGGLELIALARFPETVQWGTPGAWIYLAALVAFVAMGVYGLAAGRPVPAAAPGAVVSGPAA